MDSPNTPCTLSSHQAIMKCPWQWRQPFLAEKLESRKRKAGDGYFYDPVDPNFVDHLLPGYAKKLCTDLLEVDEKEKIQREIERLMLKKEEEHDEFVASAAMIYDSLLFLNDEAGISARTASSTSLHVLEHDDGEGEASTENQALIDSILLMSKTVEEASHASSLLASPLSESASSDEEDLDASSSDESSPDDFSLDDSCMSSPVPDAVQSPSLDLMSDNLQESLLSVEEDDLLDFACPSTSHDDDQ